MKLNCVIIFKILFLIKIVFSTGIWTEKGHLNAYNGTTKLQELRQQEFFINSNKTKFTKIEQEKDLTEQKINEQKTEMDNKSDFLTGRNHLVLNGTKEENGSWNLEEKEKRINFGFDNQKNTCNMASDALLVTAQSFLVREINKLSTANEMEARFDNLRNILMNQMDIIKSMIFNVEERLTEHGNALFYFQKQFSTVLSKSCSITNGNENGGNSHINEKVNNKNYNPGHDYLKVSAESVKNQSEEIATGARDPEILKFNSSIHTETSFNGSSKKVFTYYWKIKDLNLILSDWRQKKSLRSQSFYIFPSGYRMYIRVFVRENEDTFYVRVGLTKGEFDDSLKWPFSLKHKIHILDQTKEGRLFEDIASRIWDPNLLCSDFNWLKPLGGDNHECVEIGIPQDVLRQKEYIKNDILIIKLTVYLEP